MDCCVVFAKADAGYENEFSVDVGIRYSRPQRSQQSLLPSLLLALRRFCQRTLGTCSENTADDLVRS